MGIVIEKNCETGELIEREETAEELEAREAAASAWLEDQKIKEAEAAAYEALKASARAKLVAGEPMTPEEAATVVL